MANPKFDALFGGPACQPEQLLTQREMDLISSVQKVTEEVVLRLGRSIAAETGQKNLYLAGGVALNCVANGKLLRDGAFENIWIQPAAVDAGGALGAALAAYHQLEGRSRPAINGHLDHMRGAYLGPSFSTDEAARALEAAGAVFEIRDRISTIANDLGLGIFDVTDAIADPRTLFASDGHFSIEGAALVADQLADYLADLTPFTAPTPP